MDESKLLDYIDGRLNEAEKAEIEFSLAQNPALQAEVQEIKALLQRMEQDLLPTPSRQMTDGFYEMLAKEKSKKQPSENWSISIFKIFQLINIPRLAYSILLILIGFGGGYWFTSGTSNYKNQHHKIELLSQEIQTMKEMMMLSLLQEKSASERLKAVNITSELPKVNDKIIDALLKTLNQDENINVRLVTVESLLELADSPKVREGLIRSINQQESPLVQIALVDAMLTLQEKKSIRELRKLLDKNNLNETVKDKVKQGLKVLL
jgi:HEAT repeats